MRLTVMAIALACAACVPFGEGSGEVRGALSIPRCTVASTGVYEPREIPEFSLAPSWFFGELRGEVLQIRIQRDSRALNETDALVIDLRDVRAVAADAPIEVRPDLEPEGGLASPVRMVLTLRATCVRFQTSLLGRGQITFRRFEPRDEGMVEASFDVDIVDGQSPRQSGELAVLGHLSGTFSMRLHLVAEPG